MYLTCTYDYNNFDLKLKADDEKFKPLLSKKIFRKACGVMFPKSLRETAKNYGCIPVVCNTVLKFLNQYQLTFVIKFLFFKFINIKLMLGASNYVQYH